MYCRGAHGPGLAVRAKAVPDRPTEVRLLLNTDPRHTPCAAPWTAEGAVRLLPELVAPATAQLRPQGGVFSGNEAQARATLETEDDLATIAAHYARQLEQAGWRCRGGDQQDPLAWSMWALGDAGMASTGGVLSLTILQQAEVRWHDGLAAPATRPQVVPQYALEVRVEWSAES